MSAFTKVDIVAELEEPIFVFDEIENQSEIFMSVNDAMMLNITSIKFKIMLRNASKTIVKSSFMIVSPFEILGIKTLRQGGSDGDFDVYPNDIIEVR